MTTLLDGLQRYYRLDGNGTEEVSAQNGVPSGAITYPAGKRGTAANFNADDSRVITAPGLNLLTDLTIAAWLYPTSVPGAGYRGIVGHGDLGSSACNYTLTLLGSTIYFFGYLGGIPGPILPTNLWSHVAVSRTTTGITKFYLNGAPTTTTSSVGPNSVPGESLRIGNLPGAVVGRAFPGIIDEVAIYDTVLNQYQVVALFGEGTPPDYATFGSPLPELQVFLPTDINVRGYGQDNTVFLPTDLSCMQRGQQRFGAERFSSIYDKPAGGSSNFNPGFN